MSSTKKATVTKNSDKRNPLCIRSNGKKLLPYYPATEAKDGDLVKVFWRWCGAKAFVTLPSGTEETWGVVV